MITDAAGNIEEHNKYEPFGDVIWSRSYVDTDNNYKFTGKERDKESGLDYFNARYLDHKLGRFMKPDVVQGNIQNPQSLNRFVYCMNNPVKYTDPSGMELFSALIKGWGGGKVFRGLLNLEMISTTRVYKTNWRTLKNLKDSSNWFDIVVFTGHGHYIRDEGHTGDLTMKPVLGLPSKYINPLELRSMENSSIIYLGWCYSAKKIENQSSPYGITNNTKGRILIANKREVSAVQDKLFIKKLFEHLSNGDTIKNAIDKSYYEAYRTFDGTGEKRQWEQLNPDEKNEVRMFIEDNLYIIGDKNLTLEQNDDSGDWEVKSGENNEKD